MQPVKDSAWRAPTQRRRPQHFHATACKTADCNGHAQAAVGDVRSPQKKQARTCRVRGEQTPAHEEFTQTRQGTPQRTTAPLITHHRPRAAHTARRRHGSVSAINAVRGGGGVVPRQPHELTHAARQHRKVTWAGHSCLDSARTPPTPLPTLRAPLTHALIRKTTALPRGQTPQNPRGMLARARAQDRTSSAGKHSTCTRPHAVTAHALLTAPAGTAGDTTP